MYKFISILQIGLNIFIDLNCVVSGRTSLHTDRGQ